MNDTFKKIGSIIRHDPQYRSLKHPLLSKRNVNKEKKNYTNGKAKSKKESFAFFEITVDIDNNELLITNPSVSPESFNIIYYTESTANKRAKHLIGNSSLDLSKVSIKSNFSFSDFDENYVKNYPEILTNESIIFRVRKLMDDNIDIIDEYCKDLMKDCKNAFFQINIKYNNIINEAQYFSEVLDEVDEMFVSISKEICHLDKFSFHGSFLPMFNYNKYSYKGYLTKPIDSIPYYDREDFLDLFYSKGIYDNYQFSIGVKQNKGIYISIFPNYDGLTCDELMQLLEINPYEFKKSIKIINDFIENKKNISFSTQSIRLINLHFDLYFRKKNDAGFCNILKLSSVRYFDLLKIYENLNEAYKLVYKKDEMPEHFLYSILNEYFSEITDKNELGKNLIKVFRILQKIYTNDYVPDLDLINILIKKTQYYIRNNDNLARENFNNLNNIYKFLNIMDNRNFLIKENDDPSFKLGLELAKIESSWKSDRENLLTRINQFAGRIDTNIVTLSDVSNYCSEIVSRLVRNNASIPFLNDFNKSYNEVGKFNKTNFIRGYFSEKYSYHANIITAPTGSGKTEKSLKKNVEKLEINN